MSEEARLMDLEHAIHGLGERQDRLERCVEDVASSLKELVEIQKSFITLNGHLETLGSEVTRLVQDNRDIVMPKLIAFDTWKASTAERLRTLDGAPAIINNIHLISSFATPILIGVALYLLTKGA